MKIELSQEYKDDLYEKVLEKRKQRTRNKKRLLSIFIVFVSFVGIATFGFSKLSKGDYINFFISKTENIEFNDEYEYYDDLGIKLEFVNKDENSLTIGINLKYEDIANKDIVFEEIDIIDLKKNIKMEEMNEKDIKKIFIDKKCYSNSEIVYIFKYVFFDSVVENQYEVFVKNVKLKDLENQEVSMKEFEWKKEISIEE